MMNLDLDRGVAGAAIRVAVGYASLALWAKLLRAGAPEWSVFLVFVLALAAMRAVPLVFRKIIPFSKEAQTVWASRRQLAKQFDSYQWQKLLWIGVGQAAFLVSTRERAPIAVTLALLCVIGGASGLMAWRKRSAQLNLSTI